MMDTSPADDNGRPYDYADANNPDEEWTPVRRPASPSWFDLPVGMPSGDGDATGGGPYTPGSAIEESGGEE
jgi:hypothetical protein